MRIFNRDVAETAPVAEVDVARWEQYQLGDALPFQAMWYEVPPGEAAPLDRHPERELSLVVTGTATVEAGGTTVEVQQGSAFLLDGHEAHRVRNSTGGAPLLVFSVYWHPDPRHPDPRHPDPADEQPAGAARERSDA